MKVNELISARYGCKFPASLNREAISYHLEKYPLSRCHFISDMMDSKEEYTLKKDEISAICEFSEVLCELFESYLYAAYTSFSQNHKKPKTLVIILDD